MPAPCRPAAPERDFRRLPRAPLVLSSRREVAAKSSCAAKNVGISARTHTFTAERFLERRACVDAHVRRNPSSSDVAHARVLSIDSPPCVNFAIILVIVACAYIWLAIAGGAGEPEIQTV